MTDIDDLIQRVWNSETRSFVSEAWGCYNAGAHRASIASTWTAITADLITKIEYLADDGDPVAQKCRADVAQARQQGLTKAGVSAMQTIEHQLLDVAVSLEIIDSLDRRSLERVREDRNICVHPTLRDYPYDPQPEVARAHLTVALEALLVHPPTQGRKLLEHYIEFTCAASFSPTPAHVQRVYYERVRVNTRRSIAELAAKHAVLELDPQGRMSSDLYADRSADILVALAERDLGLVRDAVTKLRERYRQAPSPVQRSVLGRLGDKHYFWDMLDDSLVDHLNQLVAEPPSQGSPSVPLTPTAAAVTSLVSYAPARQRLSNLEPTFGGLSLYQKLASISTRPSSYFVPHIITLLQEAPSWEAGTRIADLLQPHARYFTLEQLAQALLACSNNNQTWAAKLMPDAIAELFRSTSHLGPSRVADFREFLVHVQSQQPGLEAGDYYSYPELDAALKAAP